MTTENTVVEPPAPISENDTAETYLTPPAPESVMPSHPPGQERRKIRRRWIVGALLTIAMIFALIVGIPPAIYAWNHVSTDDAQVNSHVTYISPRVQGLTEKVLVDDNDFVTPGEPIIEIDHVPYQLAVDQRQAELDQANLTVAQQIAALDLANAQLQNTRAQVRSKVADLRGAAYLVATVQDFVKYETAALQSNVANLRQQQANLKLAQDLYNRAVHLGPQSVSQEEIDERRSAVAVAEAQVASADANIQQTRALLSLPPDETNPGVVPVTVAQTFNGTQYAISTFLGEFAQLGLDFDSMTSPPLEAMKNQLRGLNIEQVVENSPSVKAAEAQVAAARAALGGDKFDRGHPENQPQIVAAQKALDQARLDLGYTDIRAPIAGYVSRRNINPGAFVAVGQPLLAIRPLSDVWIDANFKETQLTDIRIGQKVDIYVDAYGDKVFHGRVSGFSPGTGAVLSLLPPENATGNFVKVVQRLPVRIELTEPNPSDTPLFAGLSVTPYIDTRSPADGPDAGRRLSGGQ
jgi:membrane fusion protein (multidrug efflux system)